MYSWLLYAICGVHNIFDNSSCDECSLKVQGSSPVQCLENVIYGEYEHS